MKKKYLILLIFCISPFLFSDYIYSQETILDTTYQTEEIIITGTRTLKKIIDIPYSVERLDKREIMQNRTIGINDIFYLVPGIFTQSRYGNHDVRISIRGFGSRSNTGIRGVRILQDDIPESEPDGQTRIEAIDFNTVGSIEIVKGNASSLYTNAPGGVVNFKSDLSFPKTFISIHNEFGSYDLRQNGIKFGYLNNDFRFLLTYSYRNYTGYREHSQEYQNILNSAIQTYLFNNSSLSVYLNTVIGIIKLPGSLTKSQYETNPDMANPQDVSRDSKRITRKGRLGVRFNTFFGSSNNNEIELTGYGTIKDFDRTARTYRLFARYGIGGSFRYINRSFFFDNRFNEFSIGGDMFYQTGPISEYQNINGRKGDNLLAQTDETISNVGFYIQDQFSIWQNKLDILLTGRYDKVTFITNDLLFAAKNATRTFEKFTPKVSLNFKLLPNVAFYTSYGLGFDTPAGNELGNYPYSSTYPKKLNPDLNPQESNNFEFGVKGNVKYPKNKVFTNIVFELTAYNLIIKNEIVPFVVDNEVYYRNAAKTDRKGLEFGLKTEVVKGLNFRTAYTYNNFKYDEYIAKTIIGDTIIVEKRYDGNIVPSVPKHNFVAELIYDYYFNQYISAYIKANWMYIDKMYVDDANTENAEAYSLVNGMIGAEFNYKGFSALLSFGVNNILDKRYVAFININDANKRYYEAGPLRNFFGGINLGYNF